MIFNLLSLQSAVFAPTLWIQDKPLEPSVVASVSSLDAMNLRLTNLPKSEFVTVQGVRTMSKWQQGSDGNWKEVAVVLRSWAKYRADSTGTVNLEKSKPISGSFRNVGSVGLLWSGYPDGDVKIPSDLAPIGDSKVGNDVKIIVQSNSTGHVSYRIRSVWDRNVERVPVNVNGVHGYFSFPKGSRGKPVLIKLHGSEGGSVGNAEIGSHLWASQGFPTLALNYFAWPHEGIAGIPNSNLNTPVELLEKARMWLSSRPEVDVNRVGLYGVSKGAEFSLVGSTQYPWIKAVVAVVPTDSVWEGYPVEKQTGKDSTWSIAGKPMPYIPLYAPVPDKFRTNTDRYEESRKAYPEEAKAALIPLENSAAKFLLLGGDRDEVWASGQMSRSLARRMKEKGKGRQVTAVTYPKAGHMISGDGTFPVRLYGVQSKDPRDKILDAEGEATVDGFKRARAFLKQHLGIQ